jgi:hypothetical protein
VETLTALPTNSRVEDNDSEKQSSLIQRRFNIILVWASSGLFVYQKNATKKN